MREHGSSTNSAVGNVIDPTENTAPPPGVSKKTGVAKRGSVTWTLTFRAGKYSYFSDAHKKLRKTFRVT